METWCCFCGNGKQVLKVGGSTNKNGDLSRQQMGVRGIYGWSKQPQLQAAYVWDRPGIGELLTRLYEQ